MTRKSRLLGTETTTSGRQQVGVEEITTPVFEGMTGADVVRCMDVLEYLACTKVMQTATPRERVLVEAHSNLAHSFAGQVVGLACLAAPVAAVGFKHLSKL